MLHGCGRRRRAGQNLYSPDHARSRILLFIAQRLARTVARTLLNHLKCVLGGAGNRGSWCSHLWSVGCTLLTTGGRTKILDFHPLPHSLKESYAAQIVN